MRQLQGFRIREEGDHFVLSLQDGEGDIEEFGATAEQVDGIIEALDDLFSQYVDDDGPPASVPRQ